MTFSYSPIIPIPVMALICVVLIILKRRGIVSFIRQIIIVVLLFLLNMRITIPTDTMTVYHDDVDILFVVDNSISMTAKDYDGKQKRLDGVRHDVDAIMKEFPTSKYALISFNSKASYMIPFTYEKELVTQALKEFRGEIKSVARGTSINVVYDTFYDALKRKSTYDEDGDRIQLVFFITDGEITSEDTMLVSFEKASKYIDGGAVLGYGTTKGGKMYVQADSHSDTPSVLEYMNEDGYYEEAVSKIDEDNLNVLADDLGLEYYHMESESDINEVIKEIKRQIDSGEMSESEENREGVYEIYWIFAAGLALLLFWDFVQYRVKFGKER